MAWLECAKTIALLVSSITMVLIHDLLTWQLQRATIESAFPQKNIIAMAFPMVLSIENAGFSSLRVLFAKSL